MTDASQKTQDLLARYEEEREWYDQDITDCEEDTTECQDLNKARIFSLLMGAGISLVTVDYSGSCDGGQIDHVLAFGPKSASGPAPEIALPEGKVTLRAPSFDDANAQDKTLSIREAIEVLCWVVLGSRHRSWEVNDGGEGVFILDVARGTIDLRHTQFYRDYGPDGWEW